MKWLRELWRRLTGKSMTGIGQKASYTITYIGNGEKDRFIPTLPPVGSTIISLEEDGFTIENKTDHNITYEIEVFRGGFLPKIFKVELEE